jgi:hypothetical protein
MSQQFLNHKPNGDFDVYHTHPWLSGTPDFEYIATVNISSVRNAKKDDGSDDEDALVVESACPICGAESKVPLCGGDEAQRLHAKKHAHATGKPYVEDAVRDTMERVRAKGGEPRLDPTKG